jgi:hypothetical protein
MCASLSFTVIVTAACWKSCQKYSPYFYIKNFPGLDKIQDKRVSRALFDIIRFAY